MLRNRGAQDFAAYYDAACAAQGSVPVQSVQSSLSQGVLDFNGDVINLTDWTPILSSLAINKHLQSVTIRSCYLSSLGFQGESFLSHSEYEYGLNMMGMGMKYSI